MGNNKSIDQPTVSKFNARTKQVNNSQVNVSYQNFKPQSNIIMKNYNLIFGVDSDFVQKILNFDPMTEKFEEIKKPISMEIFNYMQAIKINEETIFMTGGIDRSLKFIQAKAYIYNPLLNSTQNLPNMGQKRYSHSSLFHNSRLYCLGGRTYGGDKGILTHCECFDIYSKRHILI